MGIFLLSLCELILFFGDFKNKKIYRHGIINVGRALAVKEETLHNY